MDLDTPVFKSTLPEPAPKKKPKLRLKVKWPYVAGLLMLFITVCTLAVVAGRSGNNPALLTQTDKWKSYALGSYKLSYPYKPDKLKIGTTGNKTNYTYITKSADDANIYQSAVIQQAITNGASNRTNLNIYVSSLTEETDTHKNIHVTNVKYFTFKDHEAVETTMYMKDSGAPLYIRDRAFIVDKDLYTLQTIGSNAEAPNSEFFFESFGQ